MGGYNTPDTTVETGEERKVGHEIMDGNVNWPCVDARTMARRTSSC